MTDREKRIIYDALCEIMFIAQEKGGFYQCDYSVDEIRSLAEKFSNFNS